MVTPAASEKHLEVPARSAATDCGRRDRPHPSGRFEALERTRVYRTLPVETRTALDTALLIRPAEFPTAEAVHEKLGIKRTYGLDVADVRQYAQALEAFARPLMASLAVSSLLKALPRRFTRGLAKSDMLLAWSRLVQRLTDPNAPPLEAAEFARLAAMLRPPGPLPRATGKGRSAKPAISRGAEAEGLREELESVARLFYGVNLARDTVKESHRPREGDPPASSNPSRG